MKYYCGTLGKHPAKKGRKMLARERNNRRQRCLKNRLKKIVQNNMALKKKMKSMKKNGCKSEGSHSLGKGKKRRC